MVFFFFFFFLVFGVWVTEATLERFTFTFARLHCRLHLIKGRMFGLMSFFMFVSSILCARSNYYILMLTTVQANFAVYLFGSIVVIHDVRPIANE